jgi:2-polyprenyl-6-methoxyphenol hydroxylase-like FAD-dependent oxidoreductase
LTDHVAVTVATARGQERVKARYLVGMDGGASTVRKALGIDFVGTTDEQDRILIVDAATSGLSKDRLSTPVEI